MRSASMKNHAILHWMGVDVKRLITAAAMALMVSGPAMAACYGSGNFYSCNDASGNNYSVQRYGNMTTMQGYNSNTGSNWSQNSYDYGSSTMTTGRDSRGNSWSQTCNSWGCN